MLWSSEGFSKATEQQSFSQEQCSPSHPKLWCQDGSNRSLALLSPIPAWLCQQGAGWRVMCWWSPCSQLCWSNSEIPDQKPKPHTRVQPQPLRQIWCLQFQVFGLVHAITCPAQRLLPFWIPPHTFFLQFFQQTLHLKGTYCCHSESWQCLRNQRIHFQHGKVGGSNNPNCYLQKRELCSEAATALGSFVQKSTSKSAAKSSNEIGSVRNCSCIYACFSSNCLGGLPPSNLLAVRAVNWDMKGKDLSKCSGLGVSALPHTSHWPEAVWPSASET